MYINNDPHQIPWYYYIYLHKFTTPGELIIYIWNNIRQILFFNQHNCIMVQNCILLSVYMESMPVISHIYDTIFQICYLTAISWKKP